jgi:hypothetical protein
MASSAGNIASIASAERLISRATITTSSRSPMLILSCGIADVAIARP